MVFSLRGAATALCIAMVAVIPGRASALTFDDVVYFGDSLTDSGNMFFLSGGAIPPSPPYAPGRTSNGAVWSEYFAAGFGLSADPVYPTVLPFPNPPFGNNYAVAGAKSDDTNEFDAFAPPPGFPGFVDQVALYGSFGPADPNTLHVVWIGANDFVPPPGSTTVPTVESVVNNVVAGIVALAGLGAERFLVANMPNLGAIPRALATDLLFPGTAAGLTLLSQAYNAALDTVLADLAASLSLRIKTADVFGFMNDVIADPTLFGMSNVTDPCLDIVAMTLCADPDEYFFWDDVHSTTAGHLRLAGFMAQAVPEPGTLALLLAGLAAFAVLARRRRAQGVALLSASPARSLPG